MKEFNIEDVIEAWKSRIDNDSDTEHSLLYEGNPLTSLLLGLLAEGHPVSAAHLAGRSGLPLAEIETAFKRFEERGGEFDEQGNLIGAALTLNKTPHRFFLNGKELFTWCSLDALFLPGLIGNPAEISSTDPVTGETIHLTITPEGIADFRPITTVLSITVPGLSCCTDGFCGPKTGPQSEACSQMRFFASRESAEVWLRDRPGIAVLSVDEAWQLAKRNWLERSQQLKAKEQEAPSCD